MSTFSSISTSLSMGLFASVMMSAQLCAQEIYGEIRDSVGSSAAGSQQTTIVGTNAGDQGDDLVLQRPISEQRALTGLNIVQRNTEPCAITASYRGFTDDSELSTIRKQPGFCGPSVVDMRQSQRSISLPAGYFANGIRICMDEDRTEVKGVEIHGMRAACFEMSNSARAADGNCRRKVHFERPKCVGEDSGQPDSDWVDTASCTYGLVAIGVQVSLRPSTVKGKQIIDGIGLKCADVRN